MLNLSIIATIMIDNQTSMKDDKLSFLILMKIFLTLPFNMKWTDTIYCVIHPKEKAPQTIY